MKARFRILAALFALSSLVLLQVEGLWASSACPPEMEMPMESHPADAGAEAPHCPLGEPGHSHEQDREGSEPPACPLMPAGAASCVGGALMPPTADQPAPGTAEDEFSPAASDHAKDLLLAVSLLRPPRA